MIASKKDTEKERFIRTTFVISQDLWDEVITLNHLLHLSSDSAATRLLLVLGLKNQHTLHITPLPPSTIKRTLEILPSLKAHIKKFQHRHEIDESQHAICHLIAHGITVIKTIANSGEA